MTALQPQIDTLEAAITRLGEGDHQILEQLPAMLGELRTGAAILERRQEELVSLYEVGQETASVLSLDQLLESILDRALVLVDAERGFLVLHEPGQDGLNVSVARQFDQGQVDSAQIEISHDLIRRVLATCQPVVTTNAQEDARFQASHSIATYQIRSVLAAPMMSREDCIGAIYVDTRLSSRLFSENDLALLEAMANQAAVAIQLARLYEDLRTRNRELQAALLELQEAQEELIRAERLTVIGRMASSIVHDLKNPMTTIKGYASLLGRDDLAPEMRGRFSQIVTRSVDTFVEMTQEILDYARGGSPLQAVQVELDPFLNDLCDFVKPDFEQLGITIVREFHYAGSVRIDEAKMRRALYNIVSNAMDAMHGGGTLTVTTRSTDDSVEIVLSDTGPGIHEEVMDSLFEPFVTHGKAKGTGLGLAIAHKAVKDHGGDISVQSVSGQGAAFTIRLPLGES
jgi:signal transduction histidine kinase